MPETARRRGESPMEDKMIVVREGVVVVVLLLMSMSWHMEAAMRTAMLMFR